MPDHQHRNNGSMNGESAAPRNPTAVSPPKASPQSPGSGGASPVTSPPYWVQSHSRSLSSVSIESITPGGITLQDNTEGHSDKNAACWAKGVHIDDHVVVNGSIPGLGAFVVWNVTVETLNVSTAERYQLGFIMY